MLNAAIIGLGWWGQEIVRSVQGKSKRLRFTRGVSKEPETVKGFAAEQGFALSTDYAEAIQDKAIDAVVLATPHSLHAEQIAAAAAAGKQVFCEKPLSLNRRDALLAVEACAKAKKILGVGHNRRFWRPMVEIKKLVDDGALGTIMQVEGNYSTDWLKDVRPETSWRGSPNEAPAGGMTGMGIHIVDAYVNMFGLVKSVHALVSKRLLPNATGDTVGVLVNFDSGLIGYLGTTMVTPYLWRYHVMGSHGWAEARSETHLVTRKRGMETQATEFAPTDSVAAEFEAWLDAIDGKGPYLFTPEQIVHTAAVLEAIFKSADHGQIVAVAA
jgi:predicted dehydrogenase